jgi:hypothetical protein
MRKWIFLTVVLSLGIVSIATGEVSVTVYLSDGNTPLVL